MEKFYCCLFLLCSPLISWAQSRVVFDYDLAGNRLTRDYVMMPPKVMAKGHKLMPENQASADMFSDNAVRIYPNPTVGILKISVLGLKGTDICSIAIYTTQGTLVMKKEMHTETVELNMSNQPVGIYLLKITLNNRTTTWKIIRQ